MRRSDCITVVVGAGGAIGEAIARVLARDDRLALLDLDGEHLTRIAQSLPPDTLSFEVDASRAAAMDKAFSAIGKAARIDRLVVSVGITDGGSIHGLPSQRWHATIDSNLTTVYHSLRLGVSNMLSDGGSIVVVGSVHAESPQPGFPAYAAAKAGVGALARQVAAEYGHRGIRVNVVTPGWTGTPHTRSRLAPSDEALLRDSTPLREFVEPEDLAEAVGWLLSYNARHITGADLRIDGGAALFGGSTVLRDLYRNRIGLSSTQ